MLEVIKIKNFAIIDRSEIQFSSGLNIISGETGAGKSIVIEAISLLLGGRASADLVRSGSEEAVIEGIFKISDLPWMRQRLELSGFDSHGDELLIKRTVHRGGRHRISINGELATLSTLHQLCDGLVDLCGQNEHQSLLKSQVQLELLDRYGGLEEKALAFGRSFEAYQKLAKKREELARAGTERMSRLAFLRYQIEEIRQANLSLGEDEALQREKHLLQTAELRAQNAEAVRCILESDENGVQNLLRSALQRIKSLNQLDPATQALSEIVHRAQSEVEDGLHFLNRYLSSVDLDPGRLELIQERLSLIADLKRKYGPQISEIQGKLAQFELELMKLDQVDEELSQLDQELKQCQETLLQQGQELTTHRSRVANKLSDGVTRELKDLKMGDAIFQVEVNPKGVFSEWSSCGADHVHFLVQTNLGDPARPLGKVASGGELSRLLLSIRRVIANRGGIGVYLFDEIDAGIGGQTAFQVGKKLKSVANYNQVICITHLPQVASFADHHLVVRKTTQTDRACTQVIELSDRERGEEIARMLGGPILTRKSRANASELMRLATSESQKKTRSGKKKVNLAIGI